MIIQSKGVAYEAHIGGNPEIKEHGIAYKLDLIRRRDKMSTRKTLIVAVEAGATLNFDQYDRLQSVLKVLDVFIEQCFIQSANKKSKSSDITLSLTDLSHMAQGLAKANNLPRVGVSLV